MSALDLRQTLGPPRWPRRWHSRRDRTASLTEKACIAESRGQCLSSRGEVLQVDWTY